MVLLRIGIIINGNNVGPPVQPAQEWGRQLFMIVCSCNVLTDHDVRSVVQTAEDPLTTSDVYGCLGCSRQCGRCARTIKRIMNETMGPADAAIAAAGDGLERRAATLDFQLAEEAA